MEFVEGETFGDYLKRAGKPKEEFLRGIIIALLDGLAAVHGAGFMHRDIKPGNIILNTQGAPVLVDFGAARQDVGGKSRSITSVVTPGYAPIEQYSTRGKQRPWTDIYALGAVAYRAITGEAPPDATERVRGDDMPPATEAARGNYSAAFLAAIDWALAVDEDQRPQDVDAWREALVGEARAQKSAAVESAVKPEIKPEVGRKVESKSSGVGWLAILGVLILGGLAVERGQDAVREAARATAQQNGQREERYDDGSVGIGRYVNGVRQGQWEFRWPDGRVDTGPYVDGKPHGRWEEQYANGAVGTGPYVDGQRHGRWVVRHADGTVVSGRYVNGKTHGLWEVRHANGTVATGPLVNHRKHGRWEERYANGTVATGQYVNGEQQGHWVWRYADGGVQEGPVVNGKRHGPWIDRFASGQVETGQYVNGKRHGRWVIRFAGVALREVCYANGSQMYC